MAESMTNTSLRERDQLNRLLRFLESETTIGPGTDAKRERTSIAKFGRVERERTLLLPRQSTQLGPLFGRRAMGIGSPALHTPSNMMSPPLIQSQPIIQAPPLLHNAFMNNYSPIAIKRGDTIMVPRAARKSANTLGGVPISLETAIDLRKIVYGSPIHSFSSEWKKSSFQLMLMETQFPYGIQTLRCGSRGLVLCVQGFLLKHLLFDREYKTSALLGISALQPNEFQRRRALTGALSEILWQAGDRRRCTVCLKDQEAAFGPDYRYKSDSVTEKLCLYEFKKYDDLHNFIKRNLEQFQSEMSNGCILFLYSLVLSRTIRRVKEDLQADHDSKLKLLTDMEDADMSLINMVLTGRATPHLHNGDLLYDNQGEMLDKPVHGIKARSTVGFLFWDKGEDPEKRTEVGSMLKTPKNPIWVTKINGNWGLVFSLQHDLVSDYRTENRFTMWYYTGLVSQPKPAMLSVETRIGRARPKTGIARKDAENKIPALENCIMTKWYGAAVKWNGTVPFY